MTMVSSGSDEVTAKTDPDADREELYRLLMLAAELVDAIGDQAERDRKNYEDGWNAAAQIFFEHGLEVGYAQAHAEMDAWWKDLAKKVRAFAGTPTFAEVQRRRAEHTDTGYTGGPVEWEPRVAEVIELKRGVA